MYYCLLALFCLENLFITFAVFSNHCCISVTMVTDCASEESNAITCVCLSVSLSISLLYLLNQLTFALDFVHMYGS